MNSIVAARPITNTREAMTIESYLVTSRVALDANLDELLNDSNFTIPEEFETRFTYNLERVDSVGAAQLIAGRLLKVIEYKPQLITVEMMNRAQATLEKYGVDFSFIKLTYDGQLDNLIIKILNKPGYKLPVAANQVEFNSALAGKFAQYFKSVIAICTVKQAGNFIDFIWQLDDFNAYNLIRGACFGNKTIKSAILNNPKWLEWCKVHRNIVLGGNALRANARYSGKEENKNVMEDYTGTTINT